MAKQFTIKDFFERFPDDNACLDHLLKVRHGERQECPKCGKTARFVRLPKEPAFSCPTPRCGYHLHPMVGTPFAKTHTALSKWFYAMYLFTTTRHGVPAKELQRQLGVTYKTAWRMGHEIRKYMAKVDGNPTLTGHVEADETYIGGVVKGQGQGPNADKKSVVFGMVSRDGDVMLKHIPFKSKFLVTRHIVENIEVGTRVSTDESGLYHGLAKRGYDHASVNHKAKEYARGDVHTNTIESIWSRLKASIRGTHIHVSRQHLQKYLGEFEFRFNLRSRPWEMFDRLVLAF